jgi:hypothetical protein
MESMRESWTDARLDDFAAHTDLRFDAVDKRFDAVDQRFDTLERRMESGFNRVDAELRGINARFDALQKTMIQTSALVIVALIGLIATQL